MTKLKFILFFCIPIIAVIVWYSPVVFKGYSPAAIMEQIVLGKNLAETGVYALEDDLNVLLSSNLTEQKAHTSLLGNKLTGYFYAFVFKTLGYLSPNNLILFSVILNSLTLLIFAFLIYYLFNFRTSIIFGLVYIFLPFNWSRSHMAGGYEFALLFLSLFFLLYFLGENRKKYRFAFLIPSGIFLALAGIARETLFLVAPVFLAYLLLIRKKQQFLFIFISLFIVLSLFYLPDFFTGRNNYLEFLPIETSEELESSDFVFYGEFYPDPYTYHFDKQDFTNEYLTNKDGQGYISSLYAQKLAVNANIKQMDFLDRIVLSFLLFLGHLARFVSLEDIGGPFIFILILLGYCVLRKNKPELSKFFVYWIFGTLFLFSFVFLAGRDHLTDFNWAIALLISLGILYPFPVTDKKKAVFVVVLVLIVVLYNFILGSHVYWGRIYDDKSNLFVRAYSSKINDLDISDSDVIALGADNFFPLLSLNYLTDKSMVVFQPRTIDKLLKNGKIGSAFETFGIKYILGYSDNLSEEIAKTTNVVNISSSDIELNALEMSGAKSWIMNLIK